MVPAAVDLAPLDPPRPASPPPGLNRLDPALLGCLALLAWLVAARVNLYPHIRYSDIPVYEQMTTRMAGGAVPYRDFDVEYPPLAVALVWVADRLPGSLAGGFSLLMLAASWLAAVGGAAAAAALGLERRRLVVGGVLALLPVLLGDLVQTRFDLAVTACLAWLLWAAASGRWTLAWTLLAGAAALKLVPVVLVPLLFLAHARHQDRLAGTRAALAGLAGAAATFVPFAAVAPAGVWRIFSYHLRRPLQLESVGANLLLIARWFDDRSLQVETSFGSQNLIGPGAGAVPVVCSLLALAGIVAVLARCRREMADGGREPVEVFVSGSAAVLSLALVFGKVLSPQYLLWIVPVTLVVSGRRGRAACALAVAALAATQLYFPARYPGLRALDPGPVLLLTVRNCLLIALAACAWTALRSPDAERSKAQARAPVPSRSPASAVSSGGTGEGTLAGAGTGFPDPPVSGRRSERDGHGNG
ncbi:MAG: glycosyltransferase 87 family protein [Acidimicrobiales bacterium]